MGVTVIAIFYGSILFCLVASVYRVVRCVRAPLHLRWELYRGSSVYELPEWWTRPQVSFRAKAKSVVLDILTLREYYHRNRRFWYSLIVFHAGLYLLVLWHIWLVIAALTTDAEKAPVAGVVWGHVATILVGIGGITILIQRVADRRLATYYPPIHYLKWAFVLVTLVGGFYAVQWHFGGDTAAVMAYMKDQLSFNMEHKLNPPLVTALHVLFVSPWMVYLPLGHVMQVFFRYYHELRWDHVPNLGGGKIGERVGSLLSRPVHWPAAHVQSGKTWREVAGELPEEATRET